MRTVIHSAYILLTVRDGNHNETALKHLENLTFPFTNIVSSIHHFLKPVYNTWKVVSITRLMAVVGQYQSLRTCFVWKMPRDQSIYTAQRPDLTPRLRGRHLSKRQENFSYPQSYRRRRL